MRRFAPAITIAFALVTPAQAAPAQAWAIDKALSTVSFSSSFDGGAFNGSFSRWTGDIRFDPANLAGSSAVVTFDMTSAVTGDDTRDQALPDDDWFAASRFPKAVFTAKSFKALGDNRYQAIGDLSLRGISKPLTLPFSLAITGETARMNASIGLNRLAFGVGQNEWKTTQVVPSTVTVKISLTARRIR